MRASPAAAAAVLVMLGAIAGCASGASGTPDFVSGGEPNGRASLAKMPGTVGAPREIAFQYPIVAGSPV